MSFPLNNTQNPISAAERARINENWERISGYLYNVQYQLNFLSGDADIDQILQDIEDAITAANNAANDANATLVDMNAALAQVTAALNDANTAVTNANHAVNISNAATQDAIDATDAAIDATTATVTATNNANAATTAANDAATAANNAKDATIAATTAAENAAITANNAASTANLLIQEMEIMLDEGQALVDALEQLDWKGAYSNTVTYRKNNLVQYNRSTYVALRQVMGVVPNDGGTDWRLVAGAGVDGQGAVNKVNGIAPDATGNVTLLPNTTAQVNTYTFVPLQTDLADVYPTGMTVKYVEASNGWINSGSLTTFKIAQSGGATFQIITPTSLGAKTKFRQYSSTGTAWSDWQEFESTAGAQTKVNTHADLRNNPHQVTTQQVNWLPVYTIDSSKPATEFPTGISVTYVNGTTGYPVTGTLMTVKGFNNNGAGTFQMLSSTIVASRMKIRRWNHDTTSWDVFTDLPSLEDATNIKIGGENLAPNAAFRQPVFGRGTTTVRMNSTETPGVNEVIATRNGATQLGFNTSFNMNFKKGVEYMLSFYIKTTEITTLNYMYFLNSGQNSIFLSPMPVINDGEYRRVSQMIKFNDDYQNLSLLIATTVAGETFTVKKLQIEEGNKLTDWTPPLKDLWTRDVGTRNYVLDSKNLTGATVGGGSISVDGDTITATSTANPMSIGLNERNVSLSTTENFTQSENLTYSFEVKLVSGNGGGLLVYSSSSMDYMFAGTLNETGKWVRMSVSREFIPNPTTFRFLVRLTNADSVGSVIQIRNPQIERSRVASDWKPAIEDDSPSLKLFKEQFAYQTAQPDGSVLKLKKPSDSARIFFRLNIPVTGDISISLDGGTTSVPLNDFSGTRINGMEAGFHEIVQGSTFFTLRNKGGVSQVQLDALITAANEVEANSEVVRLDLIDAVNTINQDANLTNASSFMDIVNAMPVAQVGYKRYATGVVTSTTAQTNYASYNSAEYRLCYSVEVPFSEIGFVPNRIIVRRTTNNTASYATTYYGVYGGMTNYVNVSPTLTFQNSTVVEGYKVNGNVNGKVDNTGFKLPVKETNISYTWEAYE